MNMIEYNHKAKGLDQDIERLVDVTNTKAEELRSKREERHALYMEGWDE